MDASVARSWVRKAGVLFVLMGVVAALLGIKAPQARAGTLGGFTMGMLMQPARVEAYDLNGILGAGAGLVVGYIYAPDTNTTPRRRQLAKPTQLLTETPH